jgi:hypothetical protein
MESPTRCPYDNEGGSASAVAGRLQAWLVYAQTGHAGVVPASLQGQ